MEIHLMKLNEQQALRPGLFIYNAWLMEEESEVPGLLKHSLGEYKFLCFFLYDRDFFLF